MMRGGSRRRSPASPRRRPTPAWRPRGAASRARPGRPPGTATLRSATDPSCLPRRGTARTRSAWCPLRATTAARRTSPASPSRGRRPRRRLRAVPGGVLWCAFNTRKAPLDDVLVRRAFSLALDRNQLSATQPIPGCHLTPATDMLSPGVPGRVPGQWLGDARPGAGGGAARRGRLPRRRRPARDHLPDPRQGQLLGLPRAIGVTLR